MKRSLRKQIERLAAQYGGGGGGGGSLDNVVEDTSPQLGGELDANTFDIDMGTNLITDAKVGQWDTAYGWGDHSSAGYTDASADETITGAWNFADSATLSFGDASDVSITWDGTDVQVNSLGFNADWHFLKGADLYIWNTTNLDYMRLHHDGADANFDFQGTTRLNINDVDMRIIDVASGRYFNLGVNSGTASFFTDASVVNLTATGANGQVAVTNGTVLKVRDAGGLQVLSAGDTDYVEFNHDGTDFNLTGVNTADINVTGITSFNVPALAATGAVTGSNLNVSNWDTAYGWGDHGVAGYLTSVQDGDIDSEAATDGHVLTADGAGNATWEAPSGGGGGGIDAKPGRFSVSGSQNLTTTEATMVFDTEDFDPDSNYSNSSGEITVTDAGYYQVSYNMPVNADGTGGATRCGVRAWLQQDQGTSTWIDTGLYSQDYHRESSGGSGNSFSGLVNLSAGEVIRVRVDNTASTDVSTETGEVALSLFRVR